MVTVMRGGEEVKISKRAGSYVTLRDLIDWTGRDAVRFFLVSRKADTEFVFDIDLALQASEENPVYYVQYAHARICSVLAQRPALPQGGGSALAGRADLSLLAAPAEAALMRRLAEYPAVLARAAADLTPHDVAFYLRELAGAFHSYYAAERFLVDGDEPLTTARLALLAATRQVLRQRAGDARRRRPRVDGARPRRAARRGGRVKRGQAAGQARRPARRLLPGHRRRPADRAGAGARRGALRHQGAGALPRQGAAARRRPGRRRVGAQPQLESERAAGRQEPRRSRRRPAPRPPRRRCRRRPLPRRRTKRRRPRRPPPSPPPRAARSTEAASASAATRRDSGRDPAALLSGRTPASAAAPAAPPATATARTGAGSDVYTYFVQAGAYSRSEEAEQQRARLGLSGLAARVTEREQAGRTVYRVRLGPYERKEDADNARQRLEGEGIEAALVRVQR